MTDTDLTATMPTAVDDEISTLARSLAQAYAAQVEWRCRELKQSVEEAERQIQAADDPEWQRRAVGQPADEVSWWSLTPLIEADPEAGWAVWERVKEEARVELTS